MSAHALTVRWSLADASPDVGKRLREYVAGTSHARFSAMEPLRFKTWRMREGEWFEGTYVWATRAARDSFAQTFAAEAATSPGSKIIGSAPELIEPFEVVAIAEGPSGFSYGAGPGEM